jgi:CRP-like cAMP-binding protein
LDINDEARQLSRVPLFSKLDPSRLKLIAFTSEQLTLDDNEFLFYANTPSDSVYLILDGTLEVMVEREDKTYEAMVQLGKNRLIGEMGVISNSPRSASIRSSGESKVLRIEADTFMDLLSENPSMSLHVMRELTGKLSVSHQQAIALKEQQFRV